VEQRDVGAAVENGRSSGTAAHTAVNVSAIPFPGNRESTD